MKNELGDKLKRLRLNAAMSADDVVKRLRKENQNYCLQSVYKWEYGKALPKIKTILALAKIYGCDISYLTEERNLTYRNLTSSEIFLLREYRHDFLFRSIIVQLMRRFKN